MYELVSFPVTNLPKFAEWRSEIDSAHQNQAGKNQKLILLTNFDMILLKHKILITLQKE